MAGNTYLKEPYVHPKIELNESDYKRILSLARANAKQIEKRARELYEQYGVFEVRIRAEVRETTFCCDDLKKSFELDCKPSSLYIYTPSMDANTDKPLVLLSEEERKRISVFATKYVRSVFDTRFGENLTFINKAREYERSARRTWKLTFLFTILGWLIAFAFFVFLFQVGFHGN